MKNKEVKIKKKKLKNRNQRAWKQMKNINKKYHQKKKTTHGTQEKSNKKR